MLDIKFILENKEIVQEGAKKKHIKFDVNELVEIDERRRGLLLVIEQKRAEQNLYSQRVQRETDEEARNKIIESTKTLKVELAIVEERMKGIMKDWQNLMLKVPNIPDMSVPEGESDEDNKEVRKWGEKPMFDFTPKNHVEIMEAFDMVDTVRGAKVAGFRGYFLKNDGVLLMNAVFQFVMDQFTAKKDFIPMLTPSLVRREAFMGTGYLPQSEDDLYKTQDDLYLTGTAEVPTMGYYMDEIIDKTKLPLKFISFSPCFRREAGSHGKDTKGVFRIHEFYKLEQVVLCEASHQESVKWHEEITENSEKILQALKLPYRVVINCGGDLGLGQVKKYDIETWVPSEERYRETHSSSYFHDFQTRRLNIRYKDDDGKLKFAHSLNNTAIAGPRILISIIENNQQADGSIKVPEVLQKYMGKEVIK
ncbi:MAG: serine--tRNA ligase [Patescibacteria group bacterium]|nr:serine--tRNA ligase [Patescibacteria group bacterium]